MYSRDFTCNSLLLSLDLRNLSDPTHKGFKDIKDKMIRTCLSPEITLTTNKNRVARAIYLACKIDFEIDPSIVMYPHYIKHTKGNVNVAK
jgi:tRNA nucleotidyltransferase/poly(A) polymerase